MTTENKEKLAIDVKLQIKDVLRYNMYIAYKSWFSKIVLVVGVLLCGWMIYLFATTTKSLDVFISENIIMLMLSVFILIATPLKVWRITAAQMQSPIFSGVSHYEFTKESIYIRVNALEDTVTWNTYSYMMETNKDFRFFVDKVQAQIIPKHNMTTEEVSLLRKLIQEANPKEVYNIKKV